MHFSFYLLLEKIAALLHSHHEMALWPHTTDPACRAFWSSPHEVALPSDWALMTARTRLFLLRQTAAFAILFETESAWLLIELTMELEYLNLSLGGKRLGPQEFGLKAPAPERGWSPRMWNPEHTPSSPEKSQGSDPPPTPLYFPCTHALGNASCLPETDVTVSVPFCL